MTRKFSPRDFLVSSAGAASVLASVSPSQAAALADDDLLQYVDPRIGTGVHGLIFPVRRSRSESFNFPLTLSMRGGLVLYDPTTAQLVLNMLVTVISALEEIAVLPIFHASQRIRSALKEES